jgi:hypothetical protein
MLAQLLASTALAGAWYPDLDGDGAGDATAPVVADTAPADHVATGDDCDDGDPDVGPGQDERCNGLDDDCDGRVDEGACPCDEVARDASTYLICRTERPWTSAADTCDAVGYHLATIGDAPENAWLRGQATGGPQEFWWIGLFDPASDNTWVWEDGAPVSFINWGGDQPNGRDDDCAYLSNDDGEWYDWSCSVPSPYLCEAECGTEWFEDLDGDGFGAPGTGVVACEAPEDHSPNDADCDDDDDDAYPGADEILDDGIDQDCDGADDSADPGPGPGPTGTDPGTTPGTDPGPGETTPGTDGAPALDELTDGLARGGGCGCATGAGGSWWLALGLLAYTRPCFFARR